jgi:hypothetical protein
MADRLYVHCYTSGVAPLLSERQQNLTMAREPVSEHGADRDVFALSGGLPSFGFGAQNLFFGAFNIRRLERISEQEKNSVMAIASQWLDHRANLFALRETCFGESIDWQRDYSSGAIGPKKCSAFINYRGATRVGAVKYIWTGIELTIEKFRSRLPHDKGKTCL